MAVLILDPDVISTPSGYFRFNRETFVWEEVTPEPIEPDRESDAPMLVYVSLNCAMRSIGGGLSIKGDI